MKKVQKPLTEVESNTLATLENFRFSSCTKLGSKRISNHDAACYIFYTCGWMSSGRMRHLLRIWRAQLGVRAVQVWAVQMQASQVEAALVRAAQAGMKLHFTYLFNGSDGPGYGFVGKDFHSESNELWKFTYDTPTSGFLGKKTIINRKTYWYRCGRDKYALTAFGSERGAALKFAMKGILKNVA